MRRLILKNFQSVGDLVMLTATVRDLHAAAPGQFQTDVRTPFPDLWQNNPHITPLDEKDPSVEVVGKDDPEGEGMHYPLIHQSNQRPYHFLSGFHLYLEEKLGIKIPVVKAMGDLHLTPQEKRERPAFAVPEDYWVMLAGGKQDCKTKHWPTKNFQQVVDAFQGEINFVQCGDTGHIHPPLRGVTNLVGKTSLRQFMNLIYWSKGVICPITCALHISAALPLPGKIRPCVVIAGGREPPSWTQYNGQQNLNVIGALDCCASGGCWNSRVEPENGQSHSLCKRPVVVGGTKYAECMTMITPEDVIRIVKKYQGVRPQVIVEPPLPERIMQLPPEESALRAAMQRARASGKYCVAIWHENAAGKVEFFKINNGLAEEKLQEAEVRMVGK